MTLFGMPAATGPAAWPATPGYGWPWSPWSCSPPRSGSRPRIVTALPCRRNTLLATGIAVASPVIGLNLAVITTDPPVLALMLLSLALAVVPPGLKASAARAAGSGAALAVACDLKSTAWLAVPVMAVMFAARDGSRTMWRFLGALVVTVIGLIALLAPAALVKPELPPRWCRTACCSRSA